MTDKSGNSVVLKNDNNNWKVNNNLAMEQSSWLYFKGNGRY